MVISWSRSSRVRWWNQFVRAWWRRVQPDHQMTSPGGGGRPAASRRRTSGTVSGIMPGRLEAAGRVGRAAAPGAGPGLEQGGGDSTDRERCHDQHGVPGDRVIEPDLRLIQAEAVLAELEAFFDRPAQPGGADQPGHPGRLAFGT
jgi:hypothetical protein